MVIKSWHVGDVIRKMREQRGLSVAALARQAGLQRSVVLQLERQGPEIDGMTPQQWQALDRLAATLGLTNGAALYKLVPDAVNPLRPAGSATARDIGSRVLRFTPRN